MNSTKGYLLTFMMHPLHVPLETAVLVSPEGTLSTRVRLLPGVGPHVFGQIVIKSCYVRAKWTPMNLLKLVLLGAP